MRFSILLVLMIALSLQCASAQGSSSSPDPRLQAAAEAAQKWYDGLPDTQKQAVDKRYSEYADFMRKHNEEMNARLQGIPGDERMLYIFRQNEEARKRRGF